MAVEINVHYMYSSKVGAGLQFYQKLPSQSNPGYPAIGREHTKHISHFMDRCFLVFFWIGVFSAFFLRSTHQTGGGWLQIYFLLDPKNGNCSPID